ncbi:hypothetical protein KAR91_09115 [Candidatus Pacearchaeota archaeon]|nr:hypothetical protein [Candidatus Pacearchaeota archaeon]
MGSGGGGFLPTALDPAGVLNPDRPFDVSNLADPVSPVLGSAFGKDTKDIRKFTDPLGILPDPVSNIPAPTIEDLIRERGPQAIGELQRGAEEAARLSGEGTGQAIAGLQPFTGTQALQEQAALLGALGPEAQQAAIQGIPISEFSEEQNRLERRGLLRRAASRGRFGAGGTVGELSDLGAAQQGRTIAGRLSALSPISDISRGAASTISGLSEADLTRQAQLLAGLGGQQAQILLGGAADIVGARSAASELESLRTIAKFNQAGSAIGQGVQAFGQFSGGQTAPTSPFVTADNPLGLTPGQGL